MSDEYFLDYDGAENAASRFGRRSVDLAGAAGQVLPQGVPGSQALTAVANLERAFSGRMYAYSDELSVLSDLVSEVVAVTNDVDVNLSLAP